MPLYEYKCPKCGVKFEKLNVKVNDDLAICPTCQYPAPKVPSTWGAIGWGAGGHWNKGV